MKQNISDKFEFDGNGIRPGIVISEFNFDIGSDLMISCIDELDALNCHDVEIVKVPGALEIPIATQNLIKNSKLDVIIALGIVIKGETDHYDHVTRETAHMLAKLSLDLNVPIIQGVISAPNRELAKARTFRGKEYARTAVQMVHTLKNL
ncbi:6,7-dimethyl-8-ribityllumazine synthase [Patescibacteria group bacterium]